MDNILLSPPLAQCLKIFKHVSFQFLEFWHFSPLIAEKLRNIAEKLRYIAEKLRNIAEKLRINAEKLKIIAEKLRIVTEK